jgi:hypothetical protein
VGHATVLGVANILSRLFGARRRYDVPTPSDEDVAAVDVPQMIGRARERGDTRTDDEVVASLIAGAELTAERHPDEELRGRAAAAAVATRTWLTTRVGEEEAIHLVRNSAGPVGEDGTLPRGGSNRNRPAPNAAA